jgi:hypothetical protein
LVELFISCWPTHYSGDRGSTFCSGIKDPAVFQKEYSNLISIFSGGLTDGRHHYDKKVILLDAIIATIGIKSDELALATIIFLDTSKYLVDPEIDVHKKTKILEVVRK